DREVRAQARVVRVVELLAQERRGVRGADHAERDGGVARRPDRALRDDLALEEPLRARVAGEAERDRVGAALALGLRLVERLAQRLERRLVLREPERQREERAVVAV